MLNRMGKLEHMTCLQYLPPFGQRAQLTPTQAGKLWGKIFHLLKLDLNNAMMALPYPEPVVDLG